MTKYESPIEIMEEFFEYRLELYAKRKKYYLRLLENELQILMYKVKFIKDVISEPPRIIIYKKLKADIINKLKELKYPELSHKIDATDDEKSYRYLTDMQLFALTQDKIDELNAEYEAKKKEFEDYSSVTEAQLWKRELEVFRTSYNLWLQDAEDDLNEEINDVKVKKKNVKAKATKKN